VLAALGNAARDDLRAPRQHSARRYIPAARGARYRSYRRRCTNKARRKRERGTGAVAAEENARRTAGRGGGVFEGTNERSGEAKMMQMGCAASHF
jgi:hypothetical protein